VLGHERYAVEYGPVLLAAVGGAWQQQLDTMVFIHRSEDPLSESLQRQLFILRYVHVHQVLPAAAVGAAPLNGSNWMRRTPSSDQQLRFEMIRGGGSKLRWKPYYEVQEELFEVYPSVKSSN